MNIPQGFDPRNPKSWELVGFTVTEGEVAKGKGDKKTVFHRKAMIPVMTDLNKAIDAIGPERLTARFNGESITVGAQRIFREAFQLESEGKGRSETADLLAQVWQTVFVGASVRGARTVTVVKNVITLPTGEKWEGDSVEQLRVAVQASYIDIGIPAAQAKDLAQTWNLPK